MSEEKQLEWSTSIEQSIQDIYACLFALEHVLIEKKLTTKDEVDSLSSAYFKSIQETVAAKIAEES